MAIENDETQIDPSTEDLKREHIAQLWTTAEKAGWAENSHKEIRLCHEAMQGLQQFTIPDDFQIPNKEQLIVRLPQRTTVPLRTINILERRRPRIRRFATGSTHTPQARAISTNTETWANAAADKAISWKKLIATPFLDGAAAATAVPTLAHWQKQPDYLDTVDTKKLKRLPKSVAAKYRPSDDDEDLHVRVDESSRVQPKKQYQRDAKGRRPSDPYFTRKGKDGKPRAFVLDRPASRKAYQQDRSAFLAHRLPFKVRVFSPLDAIPTFDDDGEELNRLIIRETFAEEVLFERGFRWGSGPSLEKRSGNEPVTLYTMFWYDAQRVPWVMYSIEGASNCNFVDDEGNQTEAKINLEDEFGMRELPVKWIWGLNLDCGDATKRGIPFLSPIRSSITTAEAFMTFKAIHAYQHAFVSWAIEVNPEVARLRPELVINRGGQPREITVKPMKAFISPGKPHAMSSPTVGTDANDTIRTLMQNVEAGSTSDLAAGGGRAASGHDRSLSRDYLETTMNQVLSGCLEAYKFLVERLIEAACWITSEYDVKVPVYANVKTPQDKGGPKNKQGTAKVVELDPEWIGEIIEVEAYYPKTGSEDIAMITILAQLYKEGLLTFYEFRERALGDEAPEDSQIALWIDQHLKTPEGKNVIAERVREKYGALMDKQMQKLIDRGLMTANGTPVVSLLPPSAPRPPVGNPPGAPGPAPIPGTPNASPMIGSPLASSMANQAAGGIIAGAVETAADLNDSQARIQQGLGIGETSAA
jgi:hypothetical protein